MAKPPTHYHYYFDVTGITTGTAWGIRVYNEVTVVDYALITTLSSTSATIEWSTTLSTTHFAYKTDSITNYTVSPSTTSYNSLAAKGSTVAITYTANITATTYSILSTLAFSQSYKEELNTNADSIISLLEAYNANILSNIVSTTLLQESISSYKSFTYSTQSALALLESNTYTAERLMFSSTALNEKILRYPLSNIISSTIFQETISETVSRVYAIESTLTFSGQELYIPQYDVISNFVLLEVNSINIGKNIITENVIIAESNTYSLNFGITTETIQASVNLGHINTALSLENNFALLSTITVQGSSPNIISTTYSVLSTLHIISEGILTYESVMYLNSEIITTYAELFAVDPVNISLPLISTSNAISKFGTNNVSAYLQSNEILPYTLSFVDNINLSPFEVNISLLESSTARNIRLPLISTSNATNKFSMRDVSSYLQPDEISPNVTNLVDEINLTPFEANIPLTESINEGKSYSTTFEISLVESLKTAIKYYTVVSFVANMFNVIGGLRVRHLYDIKNYDLIREGNTAIIWLDNISQDYIGFGNESWGTYSVYTDVYLIGQNTQAQLDTLIKAVHESVANYAAKGDMIENDMVVWFKLSSEENLQSDLRGATKYRFEFEVRVYIIEMGGKYGIEVIQ